MKKSLREKTKTMIKRGKNDTQIDEMKRTKWKSVTTAEQRMNVAGTNFHNLPPTHRELIWSFEIKKNTATTSTQHRLHQRYTHSQGYDSKNNNNSNNIEYRKKKMHNSWSTLLRVLECVFIWVHSSETLGGPSRDFREPFNVIVKPPVSKEYDLIGYSYYHIIIRTLRAGQEIHRRAIWVCRDT